MKKILRTLIVVLLGTTVLFTACDKKETVTAYKTGNIPVLSSNALTVAPAAADSNKAVLNLSWTNPGFATDSASEKFIIQIDSSKDFTNAYSLTVSGILDTSFIAKQFNSILLGFGFQFGIAYNINVRLVASYANNNDQKISNVLTIKATPYKVPPKIPVPANLYIVGDAVDLAPGSGWSNPVNAPYQQLTQLDETTFGGIFDLDAGKSFLFLPVNGSWDHKYGGASATGGNLFVDGDVPGSNTPAPSTSGWYVVIVNFQTGTYSITPHASGPSLPDSLAATGSGLWIIGDATPESPAWTNDPASLAKQQFARLSNSEYQVTLSLSSTGQYLFLPVAGSWDNKYACDNTGSQPVTGGAFGFDASSNFPGPSTTGNYLIDVNFVTGKYTLTPH